MTYQTAKAQVLKNKKHCSRFKILESGLPIKRPNVYMPMSLKLRKV